jgi:phosphate transport system permease protein
VRKLAATDPAFTGELERLITEAGTRWSQIRAIDKGSIGENSARKLAVERRLRKLGDGPGKAEAEKELAALKAEYVELSNRANSLRVLQRKDKLAIRLASGEARDIEVGKIVGIVRPNQLGFFGRLGVFAGNLVAFVWENPREANTEGGIFPAIFGTFVMTLMMSVGVVPFGVLAAVYLREYAKQGPFVRAVRIAVNNLAGVPSIVFGVFGLGFFVYFLGSTVDSLFFGDYLPTPTFGTGGILWAAATLSLMTVPVVIVATEEAIAAVPRGAKEASLALGASKWQTIQRIVLPASIPGILTGTILAMARGAGEVAPLMLVGVVKLAPTLPLNGQWPFIHLDQKFMHLGFHIYDLGFQSPDSEAAKPAVFATTLFLILLVLILNLAAILMRERLRRKFKTSAF